MRPSFCGVNHQQNRAHADKAVGNVEHGVMPVLPIHQQEIHHFAVSEAVDDVAERTADNHGGGEITGFAQLAFADFVAQPAADGKRKQHEQIFLPAASARQKAECRTGIVHQRQIEKTGDDIEPFRELEVRQNPQFADLVEDERGNGGDEIGEVFLHVQAAFWGV